MLEMYKLVYDFKGSVSVQERNTATEFYEPLFRNTGEEPAKKGFQKIKSLVIKLRGGTYSSQKIVRND